MQATETLQHLLDGELPALSTWLADPLPPGEAVAWRERVACRLMGEPGSFNLRLAEIIVRYWCEEDALMHYQTLVAVVDTDRQRAQLEFCYGQLLIARKRLTAWRHLERGFALAVHDMGPDEYFQVLRRHGNLRQLALSQAGSEPESLSGLLKEAGVIARLRGSGGKRRHPSDHQDTVD
jgi:hypothetical protein